MPADTAQKPLVSFRDAMAKEMAPLDAAKLATAGQPAQPAAKPAESQKPDVTELKPATDFESVDKEIEAGKRSPHGEDFRRVKTAARELGKKVSEYEPKLKEYEKELTELKKAPKHNAEIIKTITEERDRYKGMFEQVAVEISPEFHSKYERRLATVKSSLPPESSEKLMALLQLPDSEAKRRHLGELTAEMDEFGVAEVVAANREVRGILNERQGELSRAQESLGKIGEERSKKQQERQTALAKTFDDVISKAQDPKDGSPAFQTKEGDEAWNKGVSERLTIAKAIFGGEGSDSSKAEASLWAAAAPEFLSQLKTVTAELQAAKETIAKMTGSTPPLNGQGAPGTVGRKLTFAENVSADIRGGT